MVLGLISSDDMKAILNLDASRVLLVCTDNRRTTAEGAEGFKSSAKNPGSTGSPHPSTFQPTVPLSGPGSILTEPNELVSDRLPPRMKKYARSQ